MRFKHEHVEKPRIDFVAQPTPSWEDFETVTLSCSIYGTSTHISVDLPVEKAREWMAEIDAACLKVEWEQKHPTGNVQGY